MSKRLTDTARARRYAESVYSGSNLPDRWWRSLPPTHPIPTADKLLAALFISMADYHAGLRMGRKLEREKAKESTHEAND
jgi:hypothetical protein